MKKRVGLLGIYHESNTFIYDVTTLDNFKKGHLLFGEEIRREYSEAYHEVGGILEVLGGSETEVVPLMFAEATPGGCIATDTLHYLWGKMVTELEENGPFDGIVVALHGAAVSELQPDMDGWWLQQLRLYLGDEKPITGTLDPHANVSRKMIEATDALVAYKTNPHIDQRETGKKAAQLMVNCLKGKKQPTQFFFQPDTTISIEQQNTSTSPCKELYELAGQISEKPDILSVSILLGFPYADVPEMGSGFLVVSDNDIESAECYARELGNYLWENRSSFIGEMVSVEEAISDLEKASKPVLMLDMGDNVGGGAPGDSTLLLEGLEQAGKWRSFVCIYDPESVAKTRKCNLGSMIWLNMGGKTNRFYEDSYHTKVTVKAVTDGAFKENQPRHGGQVNFNMGKIAVVETVNSTTIMLTSLRIAPFSLNQLITFGIDPEKFDVIVAKGVHAPIAAYGEVCESLVQVNTDGVTQADMTKFSFVNRRKPLYPFEK